MEVCFGVETFYMNELELQTILLRQGSTSHKDRLQTAAESTVYTHQGYLNRKVFKKIKRLTCTTAQLQTKDTQERERKKKSE